MTSSTSAYTVQIGTYSMNMPSTEPGIDSDGHVIAGRPNPIRITWTKENEIAEHKIPKPKHKTSRTSTMTLWKLDLEFNILTQFDKDEIATKIDQVGPFMVQTAFKSMMMYIKSGTITAEAGYDDYHLNCSLKLIECND